MFSIVDDSPIVLPSGLSVETADVLGSVETVNESLRALAETTSTIAFNIFDTLDFRMLSGLIGESLVGTLVLALPRLEKNPNIDGYPDLMDVSEARFRADVRRWRESDLRQFIKYPHGGFEVKNTFGAKKGGSQLLPGEQRLGRINRKLPWKAHHRTTNYLLAIFSDYIDQCPQIVGALYADTLTEADWGVKQHPKEGSTMTSFSEIKTSGCDKLREGLRFCIDDSRYLEFLGAG